MAKKSTQQRNEEQRLRQSHVRKTAKELKRPSRDDLARMLLWQMINGLQQSKKVTNLQLELDNLCNMIVSGLVKQGFDERQSEEVFDTLAKRYACSMPPFRIKRHFQNDTHATE